MVMFVIMISNERLGNEAAPSARMKMMTKLGWLRLVQRLV